MNKSASMAELIRERPGLSNKDLKLEFFRRHGRHTKDSDISNARYRLRPPSPPLPPLRPKTSKVIELLNLIQDVGVEDARKVFDLVK